jgi:hypothetical protein
LAVLPRDLLDDGIRVRSAQSDRCSRPPAHADRRWGTTPQCATAAAGSAIRGSVRATRSPDAGRPARRTPWLVTARPQDRPSRNSTSTSASGTEVGLEAWVTGCRWARDG